MIPIFFARAVQVVVSIALMRAMTTLLSPIEVGAISLALSVSAVFNMSLINPVWMFMLRRVHMWHDSGVLSRRIFGLFAWYLVGVSALVPLILGAMMFWGWHIDGHGVDSVLAISVYFSTFAIVTTLPLVINTLGNISAAAYLNGGIALASLAGCVLMVKLWGATMAGWLLGLSAGYVVVAVVGLPAFVRIMCGQERTAPPDMSQNEDITDCFRFAVPLSISVLFAWMQLYGYRFVFVADLGAHRLGIFFSGYAVGAAVVCTVENVLVQYFQPIFYRRVSSNNPVEAAAAWEDYSAKVLPSLLLCVAFTVGAAPFLGKILLGNNFQGAATFAGWGASVEALRAMFAVFSLSAHAQARTRPLILANLIAASAALALSVILIPRLGELGAGVALVLSFFSGIATVYYKVGQGIRMRISRKTISDAIVSTGFVLVASVAMHSLVQRDMSMIRAVGGVAFLGIVFAVSLALLLRTELPRSLIGRFSWL